MSLMQEIFALDLEQNKKDSSTTLAVTARRVFIPRLNYTNYQTI
jgi:hypothetical protein